MRLPVAAGGCLGQCEWVWGCQRAGRLACAVTAAFTFVAGIAGLYWLSGSIRDEKRCVL